MTSVAVPTLVYLCGGIGPWKQIVKRSFTDQGLVFLDAAEMDFFDNDTSALWRLSAIVRSDLVFFFITDEDAEIDKANTLFELGYTFSMGKPIILVWQTVYEKYLVASATLHLTPLLSDGIEAMKNFLEKYSAEAFSLNTFNGLARVAR